MRHLSSRHLHHRHLVRPLVAAAAVALLAIGVAGCGDDDDTSTGDDGGTTPAAGDDYGDAGGGTGGEASGEHVVVAEDFSLTDLTVASGQEFTLDNQGDAAHTLTADDGSFDSGEVTAGSQSDPLTAPNEPGSYPFHCEIHPAMKATLTVEG
jgi:plastocyanin